MPGRVGRYIREQYKALAVMGLNFNGGGGGYQETHQSVNQLIRRTSTWMNVIQRIKSEI